MRAGEVPRRARRGNRPVRLGISAAVEHCPPRLERAAGSRRPRPGELDLAARRARRAGRIQDEPEIQWQSRQDGGEASARALCLDPYLWSFLREELDTRAGHPKSRVSAPELPHQATLAGLPALVRCRIV